MAGITAEAAKAINRRVLASDSGIESRSRRRHVPLQLRIRRHLPPRARRRTNSYPHLEGGDRRFR